MSLRSCLNLVSMDARKYQVSGVQPLDTIWAKRIYSQALRLVTSCELGMTENLADASLWDCELLLEMVDTLAVTERA